MDTTRWSETWWLDTKRRITTEIGEWKVTDLVGAGWVQVTKLGESIK